MASRRYRKSHIRSSKNLINKTIGKSVGMVKSTSQKYAPKIKSGLQSVGSKVIKTSKQTIPYLQKLTRKAFGVVGIKSGTKRHRKRHH